MNELIFLAIYLIGFLLFGSMPFWWKRMYKIAKQNYLKYYTLCFVWFVALPLIMIEFLIVYTSNRIGIMLKSIKRYLDNKWK